MILAQIEPGELSPAPSVGIMVTGGTRGTLGERGDGYD
jgi:hypothetical protein